MGPGKVSRPDIVITRNVFDGKGADFSVGVGIGSPVGALLEIPEDLEVSILIKDERLDRRARTSRARFLHLVEGRTGTVRLGPCPECGRMGVYENGRVVHDPDFDLIEEVMES
jgi:hypothetical protein